MRKTRFFNLSLLIVFTLALQASFAQDYTRWGLPDSAIARLGKGGITGNVAYSPDGRRLAVTSNIGIWLYDARTYAEVNLIARHTRIAYSVAFSPDSAMLAVGYYDALRLWDAGTGKHVRTLEGHVGGINCVAFSPDGFTLASGSRDSTIRLWDARTGVSTHTLEGHSDDVVSVAFSPDGFTLASGSDDDTIRLWDVRSGEAIQTLSNSFAQGSYAVAFSPDGLTLAGARLPGAASLKSPPGRIELWDTGTWEHVQTLEGHKATVGWVAFSPRRRHACERGRMV